MMLRQQMSQMEWTKVLRMTLRSHRFIDVPVMISLPIRTEHIYRKMKLYPLRMMLISLAETSDSHFEGRTCVCCDFLNVMYCDFLRCLCCFVSILDNLLVFLCLIV